MRSVILVLCAVCLLACASNSQEAQKFSEKNLTQFEAAQKFYSEGDYKRAESSLWRLLRQADLTEFERKTIEPLYLEIEEKRFANAKAALGEILKKEVFTIVDSYNLRSLNSSLATRKTEEIRQLAQIADDLKTRLDNQPYLSERKGLYNFLAHIRTTIFLNAAIATKGRDFHQLREVTIFDKETQRYGAIAIDAFERFSEIGIGFSDHDEYVLRNLHLELGQLNEALELTEARYQKSMDDGKRGFEESGILTEIHYKIGGVEAVRVFAERLLWEHKDGSQIENAVELIFSDSNTPADYEWCRSLSQKIRDYKRDNPPPPNVLSRHMSSTPELLQCEYELGKKLGLPFKEAENELCTAFTHRRQSVCPRNE